MRMSYTDIPINNKIMSALASIIINGPINGIYNTVYKHVDDIMYKQFSRSFDNIRSPIEFQSNENTDKEYYIND